MLKKPGDSPYLKLVAPHNFNLPQIKPGEMLGVFAPAGPFDLDKFKSGLAILRSWGFEIHIPKGLAKRHSYLAGSDEHRLSLMAELMENRNIKALIAARGGYGCLRLLPSLNKLWKKWEPKPIFGFSDITALHLARFKAVKTGGFHAPVMTSLKNSSQICLHELKQLLLGQKKTWIWKFSNRNILKKGQAKGPLLGGNLSLLAHMLGGPYLPDFKDAILLLEDVGEEPYRLDRLLTSLKQSKIWKEAAGLVLGHFTNCGAQTEVNRLLKEAVASFNGPVVFLAPFGHVANNRPFPVGALAELNV